MVHLSVLIMVSMRKKSMFFFFLKAKYRNSQAIRISYVFEVAWFYSASYIKCSDLILLRRKSLLLKFFFCIRKVPTSFPCSIFYNSQNSLHTINRWKYSVRNNHHKSLKFCILLYFFTFRPNLLFSVIVFCFNVSNTYIFYIFR